MNRHILVSWLHVIFLVQIMDIILDYLCHKWYLLKGKSCKNIFSRRRYCSCEMISGIQRGLFFASSWRKFYSRWLPVESPHGMHQYSLMVIVIEFHECLRCLLRIRTFFDRYLFAGIFVTCKKFSDRTGFC